MKAIRIAYAVLGVGFVIIFVGVYLSSKPAHAPAFLVTDSAPDSAVSFSLSSSAFAHNERIPELYTCDGANLNPPLDISGVPAEAGALVLVMDSRIAVDNTEALTMDHWVLYNIPVDTAAIDEGGALGSAGKNTAGGIGYRGPCIFGANQTEKRTYSFRLYALSSPLQFITVPSLREVETAAEGNALAKTQLSGWYGGVNEADEL